MSPALSCGLGDRLPSGSRITYLSSTTRRSPRRYQVQQPPSTRIRTVRHLGVAPCCQTAPGGCPHTRLRRAWLRSREPELCAARAGCAPPLQRECRNASRVQCSVHRAARTWKLLSGATGRVLHRGSQLDVTRFSTQRATCAAHTQTAHIRRKAWLVQCSAHLPLLGHSLPASGQACAGADQRQAKRYVAGDLQLRQVSTLRQALRTRAACIRPATCCAAPVMTVRCCSHTCKSSVMLVRHHTRQACCWLRRTRST